MSIGISAGDFLEHSDPEFLRSKMMADTACLKTIAQQGLRNDLQFFVDHLQCLKPSGCHHLSELPDSN